MVSMDEKRVVIGSLAHPMLQMREGEVEVKG